MCVTAPTEEKLPIIAAWVCCGLMAICATLVDTLGVTTPETPSWLPVSAPVAGLTSASAVISFPGQVREIPAEPDHAVDELDVVHDAAAPAGADLGVERLSEPSLTLIAATPRRVTPAAPGAGATLLKLPDT